MIGKIIFKIKDYEIETMAMGNIYIPMKEYNIKMPFRIIIITEKPLIFPYISINNVLTNRIHRQDDARDMTKNVIINQYGSQNRYYSDSDDKSVNIIGDLTVDDFENLKALIEREYKKDDKKELLQTVDQMKQFCKDLTKRNWLREKLGWLLSRTSEVASISSFAITILQNVK